MDGIVVIAATQEPTGFKEMKKNANSNCHYGELYVASIVSWNDTVCWPDLKHVLGSRQAGANSDRPALPVYKNDLSVGVLLPGR
jgi:hypothetical protein